MHRTLATLLVATGGVVAGLFGSLLGNHLQATAPEPPAIHTTAPEGVTLADWQRARLTRQARGARSEPPPPVAQPTDDPAGEARRSKAASNEAEVRALVLDPALARAAALERWTDALAHHDAERADPSWAGPTSLAFETDLRGLAAARGFRLLTAQCRTSTCSARLEWPDYASALQNAQPLVQHTYRTNCGTATALPEPPTGAEQAPYQMVLLYDCASARAGS